MDLMVGLTCFPIYKFLHTLTGHTGYLFRGLPSYVLPTFLLRAYSLSYLFVDVLYLFSLDIDLLLITVAKIFLLSVVCAFPFKWCLLFNKRFEV